MIFFSTCVTIEDEAIERSGASRRTDRMQINEKAYAKINLFLDVVGKAPDGYHEIVSVMHSVSLCDEVSLSVERASYSCITLSVRGEDVPNDERNLAYIAAEAFLEKTGIAATVDITLEKQIPTKAGLGGGSSDAAAVLRALNLALGSPLTTAELCELGAEIGADVPFCIVGGTRLCRGRGEKMSAYPMDDLTLIGDIEQGAASLSIDTGIGGKQTISTTNKFLPLSYKFNLFIILFLFQLDMSYR